MDSPTSQYRNAGCTYWTKKFDEEHRIDIWWVFTKSGHGKGPMDGVGAAAKRAINEAVIAAESMPAVSVRSTKDLILILSLMNVVLSTYDNNDIETVKATLPTNLSISWKHFLVYLKYTRFISVVNFQVTLNGK